jgi:hypothetical protein
MATLNVSAVMKTAWKCSDIAAELNLKTVHKDDNRDLKLVTYFVFDNCIIRKAGRMATLA